MLNVHTMNGPVYDKDMVPGKYVMITPSFSTKTESKNSEQVAKLKVGEVVNIRLIKVIGKERRIRGCLNTNPESWMTLKNTKEGKYFAEKLNIHFNTISNTPRMLLILEYLTFKDVENFQKTSKLIHKFIQTNKDKEKKRKPYRYLIEFLKSSDAKKDPCHFSYRFKDFETTNFCLTFYMKDLNPIDAHNLKFEWSMSLATFKGKRCTVQIYSESSGKCSIRYQAYVQQNCCVDKHTEKIYDKIILKIYPDQKIFILEAISETYSKKNKKLEIKYGFIVYAENNFLKWYYSALDALELIPPLSQEKLREIENDNKNQITLKKL